MYTGQLFQEEAQNNPVNECHSNIEEKHEKEANTQEETMPSTKYKRPLFDLNEDEVVLPTLHSPINEQPEEKTRTDKRPDGRSVRIDNQSNCWLQ